MAIERWQPFSELMSLRQAMDKLFEDSFVRPHAFSAPLVKQELQPWMSTRLPTRSW
jgi:hypothetical protein